MAAMQDSPKSEAMHECAKSTGSSWPRSEATDLAAYHHPGTAPVYRRFAHELLGQPRQRESPLIVTAELVVLGSWPASPTQRHSTAVGAAACRHERGDLRQLSPWDRGTL